ncbi:LysR family transcriptional regulator [Paraferrimonas haliotis]|uniref:LysR family transcriptional regulator n=1 Tax=Paraferrimonas haliotis TaxID=2013866 RepID=A0AA37WYT4_9GAMM|nr:LysR family transcriptional regulator [Paraferrimonas haliotis]GLS84949.1 LysR family transcriptional regulator [Paraferrimonas haliotis]
MRTRSDDLEIFLAVADLGSFSAAANILNIQVAKVSRSVSKLEIQLNTSLFNRTTRRVELTNEGRLFVDKIRQGIQIIEHAEEDIAALQTKPKGKLRVDAASPFVLHQLVPLVAEFGCQYPEIELELTSNEGFVDLIEKRTDVAIRIGPLADSTLHAKPLGTSRLHIVASPDYLAKHGTPLLESDLIRHKLIGFTEPKTLNYWPLSGKKEIQPSISSSSGETVRKLALLGNGIACLSGFMINKDIAKGTLVSLLEDRKLHNTDREKVSAVYYRSSNISSRIAVFINFIESRLTL